MLMILKNAIWFSFFQGEKKGIVKIQFERSNSNVLLRQPPKQITLFLF